MWIFLQVVLVVVMPTPVGAYFRGQVAEDPAVAQLIHGSGGSEPMLCGSEPGLGLDLLRVLGVTLVQSLLLLQLCRELGRAEISCCLVLSNTWLSLGERQMTHIPLVPLGSPGFYKRSYYQASKQVKRVVLQIAGWGEDVGN